MIVHIGHIRLFHLYPTVYCHHNKQEDDEQDKTSENILPAYKVSPPASEDCYLNKLAI